MKFLIEVVLLLSCTVLIFAELDSKEAKMKYKACVEKCKVEYKSKVDEENNREELRDCIRKKCVNAYRQEMLISPSRMSPEDYQSFRKHREERRLARLQEREEP